ncbi:MAG: type II toxin-antitoxin system VapC family toxin [Candidatus Methanoperedens sp.]|nr:type II toxin-antitoxin system VapC family toxin [Candidatus Methanoperedens sp.]
MIAIDTGVWIEYINTRGTLHPQAKAVIDSVNRGGTTAILTPLTLTEIYYVAGRVYHEVHAQSKSEILARKLYDFVHYHPYVEIKPLDYELCLNAAIIKSRYNIAFSDCFLLALSENDNVAVLFKNVESEMKQNIKELNKHFNLKFLENYS